MTPFQYDRPVFVKVPFNGGKRDWNRQEHFPWRELSVDRISVEALYNNEYLYHNEELEVQAKVGDGLEALDVEALSKVVASINEKVKAKTSSQADYDRKKCKQSRIVDKQRGLIRSWRRTHGQLEND
jgi:hypothetical protein|tara:strand:- start:345 stop:725 length:381 start_codon:yes stop_codon:yes gene_type:complete